MAAADNERIGQVIRRLGRSDRNYANVGTLAGLSNPPEQYRGDVFVNGQETYVDYLVFIDQVNATGITLKLCWSSTVASNEVRWSAAMRCLEADDSPLASHTYTYITSVDATMTGADDIVLTDLNIPVASMDGCGAGEFAIVRIRREGDHANDDNTGAVTLHGFALITDGVI